MDLHKVDTRNAQSSKALDNMPGEETFFAVIFLRWKICFSRPQRGGFIWGKLKKKMKRPNSHFERRGGKYGSYRSFFLVSKNFKKTVQKNELINFYTVTGDLDLAPEEKTLTRKLPSG